MSMSWKLSRFHAGEWVEVRSKEEILATLDERGCLDGMPFMPEMLRYCGRRFRVSAVAHKSCDTSHNTNSSRRLGTTVHLAGLRCDGSAHGGCDADCNLFWKDAWLKRPGRDEPVRPVASGGCSESQLHAATGQAPPAGAEGPHFACQATRLFAASAPLAWWDPRQYLFDVLTRNWGPGRVLRVLWLAALRHLQPRVPVGYRLMQAFHDRMHRALVGRTPAVRGRIARGALTPTGRLDLRPGEWVRIKSQAEIEATLNENNKNRGLLFDAEMATFCGRVVRVRKRVSTIVDESSGKVLHMKEPCIALEGVVCGSEYTTCKLMCPRAITSYWREIWLERVEAPVGANGAAAEGHCDNGTPAGDGRRVGLPLLREAKAGERAGVAV